MALLEEMNDIAKVAVVGAANLGAAGAQKIADLAHESILLTDLLHGAQLVLALVSIVYVGFKLYVGIKNRRAKKKDA